MAAQAIARLAMVGKALPKIKARQYVDTIYIDSTYINSTYINSIKETSQGYPCEAGEKFYYFNGSYYYSADFSSSKFADIFSRLLALTIIH